MWGDDFDRRISFSKRVGTNDVAVSPIRMPPFDKSEANPMAEGRRVSDCGYPAVPITRDVVALAENRSRVKDFSPVFWEYPNKARTVVFSEIRPILQDAANIRFFV